MTSIDICFIIDATGSMADAINGVKQHIQDIVTGIRRQYDDTICIRTAVSAYRDYPLNENSTDHETLDFTTDIERFKCFLDRLSAEGGLDEAEDVMTGLEQAARLNWASASRLIVHIADAPCHGRMYHGHLHIGDDYPNGDKYGRTSKHLFQTLKNVCGVNSFKFIHLNSTTKPMVAIWKTEQTEQTEQTGANNWITEDDLEGIYDNTLTETIVTASMNTITRDRRMFDAMRTGMYGDIRSDIRSDIRDRPNRFDDTARNSPRSMFS